MIQVALRFDGSGRLAAIDSVGHAPKALLMELFSRRANTYNAVCAALSVLEFTLAKAVEDLTDAVVDTDIRKGRFRLEVRSRGSRPEVLDTLFSQFTIGLTLLEARHGDVLSLQHPS